MFRQLTPKSLLSQSRSWLLKNAILPTGEALTGHAMMRRLGYLEQAQWWDADRLRVERDRLVRSVVTTAYHEVPFYRVLMDRVRLRPENIRGAVDLRRLPVVTKAMLLEAYPDRTCRETGRPTYEASTSGSTGKNFFVREDAPTAAWYRASFLLALEWAGWNVGEPHVQTGMNLQRSFDRRMKDWLLSCHYASAFDLSDAQLDQTLYVLDRYKIDHLWGYPGSLYYLARRASGVGWNRPLKSVVTWGDNLIPAHRRTIEAAFCTRVFDTYGCGEGIQVAAQCGQGDTYHVHALDVVIDVVDDDGVPVPPGGSGNLILTRLHAGPMPLIRYEVGDVGCEGVGNPCACGRGFERLTSIQGRRGDVVITPAGNRLIVHFFTGILEYFPEIDSFQVVQESRDTIRLRLVPTMKFKPECQSRIIAALRAKGAGDMKIDIEIVREIPLTAGGKRRFVISEAK